MYKYLVVVGTICVLMGTALFAVSEEESRFPGLHKPGNLLLNPDFALERTDGTPFGWKFWRAKVSYDMDASFLEGMPAVKMEFSKASDFHSYPFEIEHGEVYEFSIWLKAERPMENGIFIDGGSGELVRKLGEDYRHWWKGKKIEISDEWKKYSITTKIPGPGDAGYCTDMKKVWVKVEIREPITIWAAGTSVVKVSEK